MGLLIPNISAISKRIIKREGINGRVCTVDGDCISPCIVLVFHNPVAGCIKDAYDITLKILDVGVLVTVEVDGYWLAENIVGEVIRVRILLHCGNKFALQDVVGRFSYCAVDLFYLLRTDAFMVVLEFHRHAGISVINGFLTSYFVPLVYHISSLMSTTLPEELK